MRRVITAAPDWPRVKWPWTVIHWGRSVVRPAISWITIMRAWNECGGNRCRRPDYGACHGEWKDKWVIVTLSLRPDARQGQKQHQTDGKNKTFPFHDTPPIARFAGIESTQTSIRAKGVPGSITGEGCYATARLVCVFRRKGFPGLSFCMPQRTLDSGRNANFFSPRTGKYKRCIINHKISS